MLFSKVSEEQQPNHTHQQRTKEAKLKKLDRHFSTVYEVIQRGSGWHHDNGEHCPQLGIADPDLPVILRERYLDLAWVHRF
jgi:hypothetical protein